MQHVLFVDIRNATRSQMAEAWFNYLADRQLRARSCGTLPAEHVGGRATQVMFELGVDLNRQHPKPITQQLLNQADLIVILGSGIYPRAGKPTQFWNLQDPTDKPLDDVRLLRDQICQRVERLIAELYDHESELDSVDFFSRLALQPQSI